MASDERSTGGANPEPHTQEHGDSLVRHSARVHFVDRSGEHVQTIDERLVIGSAPAADVVLDDRTVSRLHAEVDPREDGLWVRDLGSRNGTFINDVRVGHARMPQGAALRLGSSSLRVSYDAQPVSVQLWSQERFGPLLGRSASMRAMFNRLARIAPTDSSVLIRGETGSGKELAARAIHEASPRSRQPYVVVDCAALSESLLQSELFGHKKGAFTGAHQDREGAIAGADGGTVFLDEIGELPLAMQPKLLRVLESREVRRIGESTHRRVDVRFISATHRDLHKMVNAGAFREDLYFRLAVLVVDVPPLRERSEDIPLLVPHLLPVGAAAPDDNLLEQLRGRPWLGNVRELRNFLERAHALGAEEALAMTAQAASSTSEASWPGALDAPYKAAREKWIERFERRYFGELIERHGRNVAEASRAAGVDRTYVYRMIKRYDL